MCTSLNLKLVTFSVYMILTLFIAGFQAEAALGEIGVAAVVQQISEISGNEAVQLTLESRKLSPEQVAELEKSVAQNPDDIKAQTLLLSYYFSKKYTDASSRDQAISKKLSKPCFG